MLAGFAVSVSFEPDSRPTASLVEDVIAPKLPAAGAVAVMLSVPTGRAVVVRTAVQEVGLAAGVPVKLAVPSVVLPVVKLTREVGQAPLMAGTVSVSVTVAPKVSPVAGEAVSVPEALAGLTVSAAVAEPEP